MSGVPLQKAVVVIEPALFTTGSLPSERLNTGKVFAGEQIDLGQSVAGAIDGWLLHAEELQAFRGCERDPAAPDTHQAIALPLRQQAADGMERRSAEFRQLLAGQRVTQLQTIRGGYGGLVSESQQAVGQPLCDRLRRGLTKAVHGLVLVLANELKQVVLQRR